MYDKNMDDKIYKRMDEIQSCLQLSLSTRLNN